VTEPGAGLKRELGTGSMQRMAVRSWVMGTVLAVIVLGGCGGTSHTGSTATTPTTAPGPASTSSSAGLPAGAPPALRGVFGRLLAANELAGFRPRGHRALGINPASWVAETELPPSERAREAERLQRLGFVAAVRERLLPVNGTPAEGLSIVEQFRTPTSARVELAAQIREVKALGPVASFAVPGIPSAVGFGGSKAGNSGANVAFAKGAYYYLVGAGWPTVGNPSPPTRAGLIAAAQRLYRRVHA
jgi:hypothetical protein